MDVVEENITRTVWKDFLQVELAIKELSERYSDLCALIAEIELLAAQKDSLKMRILKFLAGVPDPKEDYQRRINRLTSERDAVLKEAQDLERKQHNLKKKLKNYQYERLNSEGVMEIRQDIWQRIAKNFNNHYDFKPKYKLENPH